MDPTTLARIKKNILAINNEYKWVVWAKTGCPWCKKAVEYLHDNNIDFQIMYVDTSNNPEGYKHILKQTHATFPHIMKKGKLIGGYTDLIKIPLSRLKR